MSISPHPHVCYHQHRGFTLVEILLVVVIVGVMAGLATLAVGNNGQRQLQQEAERLHQRLRMAQDKSMFSQKSLGVLFSENGYHLLQYDAENNLWQPLQTSADHPDGLLREGRHYEFDIPVVVSLELAGAPLKLSRDTASDFALSNRPRDPASTEEDMLQPELVLLANGESSPFTLTLQWQNDERSIQVLHSDGFSPITRSSHSNRP